MWISGSRVRRLELDEVGPLVRARFLLELPSGALPLSLMTRLLCRFSLLDEEPGESGSIDDGCDDMTGDHSE